LVEVPAQGSFPKSRHLRKTDEISSVFAFKHQEYGEFIRVLLKPNDLGFPRLAVVIGKKTAPLAVQRNYMKRVVREQFRRFQDQLGGFDIVVHVRKRFLRGATESIKGELLRLVSRLQQRICNRV
jgi:ribonuclease P protein component